MHMYYDNFPKDEAFLVETFEVHCVKLLIFHLNLFSISLITNYIHHFQSVVIFFQFLA